MAAWTLSLSIQFPDASHKALLPRARLRKWVAAAQQEDCAFTLRFVDAEEGRALNSDYRGKDYATNVLTFAYDEDMPAGEDEHCQADIVLCRPVVQAEAEAQGKTLEAHYAHLVVHGVLHAQGYDHERKAEAERMEALETGILAHLGFADPYGER
ncbi:MAG: rRNA maturation RNase YbeY [Candidatus Protistobacter heckmanni]|nr:rRNA maturation RNase YbeY [Candidatus Protistobacter heckmanni]